MCSEEFNFPEEGRALSREGRGAYSLTYRFAVLMALRLEYRVTYAGKHSP